MYKYNKNNNIFTLQEGLFDKIGSLVSRVTNTVDNKLLGNDLASSLASGGYSQEFSQKIFDQFIVPVQQDPNSFNFENSINSVIDLFIAETKTSNRVASRNFEILKNALTNDNEVKNKYTKTYPNTINGFVKAVMDLSRNVAGIFTLVGLPPPVSDLNQDKNLLAKAEKENLIAILEESIKKSKSLMYLNEQNFTELTKNNFAQFLNSLNIDSSKDNSIVAALQEISNAIPPLKNQFSDPASKKEKVLCRFLVSKQILSSYITQISDEIEQKQTTSFPNTLRKCQEIKTSGVLASTTEMNELYEKMKQRYESTTPSDLTERKLIREFREEIENLLIPSMQQQLKFDRPPSIVFAEDEENAKDMFGRTAHYNPNTSEITVFISGRHPKDIMRSVAHEVVHHAQNCRGEFDNAFNLGEEGYAQSNNHLRKMEKQAYLLGNMLFRDWEDNLKKQRNSNTMINENALRAKIRSLIAEEMGAFEQKNEPVTYGSHDGKTCEEMGHTRESHEQFLSTQKGVHNLQGYSRKSSAASMNEAIKKAERDSMPLNEWRNKELNSLLMSRFGIVAPHAVLGEQSSKEQKQKEHEKYFGKEEQKKEKEKLDPKNPYKRKDNKGSKPDYIDIDGDGDKTEPMKQAAKQVKGGKKETEDKSKKSKGKVPPQLQKYVKGKK
jgi:hypothetical protein